jgi:predicted Zn-dependent protease with MMP-like domain
LKDLQIKSIVDQILIQSESSVKVELESYFPGDRFAGGKYNFASHTITLYIEEIKAQCQQIFSSLDHFGDYLAVVFAHEIGHAEDSQLADLIEQMDASNNEYTRTGIALNIEKNAWEYARMLIPQTIHPFMDRIIHYSLQPYYEALEISA